ncbi:MAG: GNAT family N-acetyltransferase [Ardenticatenales bacterium]|nr:GNAT family N-acetyltransferase [Ardenticatenales bacterium]
MIIRPYVEADDPALMVLERQCPRGDPDPFVHYRRRFVDRAALFTEYYLLLIESQGTIVAVAAASIKNSTIKGQSMRIGYIFDVRVSPAMRRQGLAATLVEGLEADLQSMGCEGVYAHVVATNVASLRLFTNLGYTRQRQLRFLTYQPMPLFTSDPVPVLRHRAPPYDEIAYHHREHDLFVEDVAPSLVPFDFECWESQEGSASISLFDQSQVFQQVPIDAPWPTPEEIARRGRHWRLFHPFGNAADLQPLFDTIRDQAVSENINKLTMLVDVEDPLPSFIYAETTDQREYVALTRPFDPKWDGTFGPKFYCDTREL